MYEGFFEFDGRPFLAAPTVSRYYPAAVIESARLSLTRVVQRGEGAGLVVGQSGTGKTLLCQLLVSELAGQFETALLASGRLTTSAALLQAILYELRLPYRGLDEGELRLSLLDHLRPAAGGKSGLLLVVDEAHSLPWRLMEELRLLTNLVRDGEPRVRVVLAGGPQLEERFAHPKMVSFSQRLAIRCYLEPLTAEETANYVRSQIEAVGGDASRVFDVPALETIYRATDGIPRLINQLCDHALLLASLGGVRKLTAAGMEEAWADLQQLPSPTIVSSTSRGSDVVEFGGLDDTVDTDVEAIPFRAAASPIHLARPDEEVEMVATDDETEEDDAFQPVATIGTEVELDFPEFGDPFNEQFAEEELLLDPYQGIEIFADVPRVSSWEGEQIGAALEPFSAPHRERPAMPTASLVDHRRVTAIRSLPGVEGPPIEIDDHVPQPRILKYRQLFVKLRSKGRENGPGTDRV